LLIAVMIAPISGDRMIEVKKPSRNDNPLFFAHRPINKEKIICTVSYKMGQKVV